MLLIESLKKPLKQVPLLQQFWKRLSLKIIPIDNIRCQVRPFSKIQGYSGRTIDFFPPCKFFQLYLKNTEKAYKEFYDWMYYCLIDLKAWKINQKDGGWRNGSLIQLIYDIHEEHGLYLDSFENAQKHLIKTAIEKKVKYYFDLFNSIKEIGYLKSTSPAIICDYKNGRYYLGGGHHRVSALYTLGLKNVYAHVHHNR